MRTVSTVVGTEPEFDLVSSIGIAVIYIAFLLPGCVALAWSHARWPWLLFAGGVVVLMFEAVAIGMEETSSAQAMTPVRWVLLVVVLGAMLATYAAQFAVAARWARLTPGGAPAGRPVAGGPW